MESKKNIVDLETFRDMLHISPRVPGQSFNELPFEEEILDFLRFLGHSAQIKTLTDVNVNKLFQPWRSFAAVINKCLTGKSSGFDSFRLTQVQILWGLYHKRNIDYAFLIWEDFVYQVKHKNQKKSNEMYYPIFTKVIIHHFMTKKPSILRQNKNTQQYGAILPIELTNEDIRNTKAYKEYYACATGEAAPKPKKSARRKRSGSDTSITPPTAITTLTRTLKIVLRRSRQESHISQLGGSSIDEGTGSKPGVPDVPSNDSEEEISWNSSDDEDVDAQDKDRNDNEGDKEDGSDNGKEDDDDADKDDSEDDGNGEEDQGLRGRGLQLSQDIEDSHVTLTLVNPDGQQESSSVSLHFLSSMLNPTSDAGMESLFATASSPIAPFQTPTPIMTPSTIATITTMSHAPIPPTPIPTNFFEYRQSNPFADAVSNISGIVQQYMNQQMNEEVQVAVQIQTDQLRDSYQRENDEFLQTIDDNMKRIIKEQVKSQVKEQVSRILPRIEESVNAQLEAEALVDDYEADKTILDSYGETTILKRKREDDDDQEGPFAGSDWGSKRRREGGESESARALLEPATRSACRSTTGSKSQQASASESAFAEEPVQTISQIKEPSHSPLPLIPDNRGPRVISFAYFINNDLEYLRGGASSRKYTTSVTKTKAADYGHIKWIEDLFYGFAVNQESALDVCSKRRIITVTDLKIVEWYNYKHLDWILVRRDDDKIYKFKEGDFKRLRLQDIENMLLLLAFPLPAIKFPLPEELPTASEDGSHCQKKRDAAARKIDCYQCQKETYYNHTTTSGEAGTKSGRTVTLTIEDVQKKKNDVKVRTTLLLSLPDEHQLRFKYKTARELWAAILKTFGVNEATKKTKKNLLKQQYENFRAEGSETLEQTFTRLQVIIGQLQFMDVEVEQDDLNQKFLTTLAPEWLMRTIVWRNRSDLDTMSLDDLYNHLKDYETEVQKKTEPNTQNMAFISSAKHSRGNDKVNTASSNVPTTSTNVATVSISQETACAYIASQSKGSQIKFEDINQIDEDDMEEMDIKWNMALLSMRADKFWKKIGKKISIQGSNVAGGRRDNYRQGSKAEEHAPKALMAIDRVGWDWSYMANDGEDHALVVDKEAPTEFALMANTSTESKELETLKQEKEVVDRKLAGLLTASNDLDNLIKSQRPSPTIESFSEEDQNRNPSVSENVASPITPKPFVKFVKESDNFVMKKKACFNCGDFNHLAYECRKRVKRGITRNFPPVNRKFSTCSRNFPTVNRKFSTASRKFPTCSIKNPTADIGMKGKDVKPSACWTWKPSQNLSNKGPKNNSVSVMFKKYTYIDTQGRLNGCSRHMTGNISYLSDYEPFDGGYVSFGQGGCMITGKKTIKSGKLEFKNVYFVKDLKPSPTIESSSEEDQNRNPSVSENVASPITPKPFVKFVKASDSQSKMKTQYRAPWMSTVNRNFSPVNRKFSTGSRNFPTVNRKFSTASRKFPTGSTKNPTADMGMKGKAGSSQNHIDDKGYWDSGCSRHMKGNISYLSDYEPFDGGYVSFGQRGCKITGKGTIKTECIMLGRDFKLLDDANILLRTPRQHNMRLGYLNFKTMNKLVRHNLVRGLPTKCFENDHNCTACLKGKQHKASCKSKLVNSVSKPLHTLHMDLFGPTSTFFLKTKDETSGILRKFITEIENLKDLKVKIIRCDNGGEFKNKELNDFCSQKGIKRGFSNARTPQQNGVAERRNKSLIEAARTMLADAKLPVTFWAEAVNIACYVQNRVLVNKAHNKNLYELFNGRTPTIGFLKPFGCHVMILNTLENLGKFEAKGDEGYFLGYLMSSKAFRVFNKRTKRVEENLHIEFLENKAIEKEHLESTSSQPQDTYKTDAPESSGNSNPTVTSTNPPADQLEKLIVETPIPTVSSPVPTVCFTDSQDPSSETRLVSKRVANQVETPSLDNILTLTNWFEDILGVTTNSEESSGVEADVSNMKTTITASPTLILKIHRDHPKSLIIGPVDTPIQTRNKSKEVGEQSFIATIHQNTDPALLQFCLFSCFLSQVEPKNITDALQDPRVRPIGTKWVLMNKKDERGIVIRNKARLVAQGHTHEEGIDYDEVFAPGARIEAIRLFLAYASFMGFTVYQMDVKSAFLYDTINEEVYVMQPPGF
nr:hypothetical protein [Tanacetum cinerariifolium]